MSLALAAGCATRADLLQVQQDQREMHALLADQQVAVDGLRRRVEILRTDMGEARPGRGGAALGELQRRVDALEARMNALEQARGTGTPPVPAPVPPLIEQPQAQVVPPPTPTPPPAESPEEQAVAKEEAALRGSRGSADFRAALELIRQQHCDQAIPKLRDFIRTNPKSDLDDNAQYWIGSCYYGQRDYNRAIIELNEVLLKYPQGDKVPAALLMLADAFADSGDKIDARLILQKLLSDHPRSEEAALGRQKLKSLSD